MVPVSLCGKRADGFGGTGACEQTASPQLQPFTATAFSQEFLDGQRLNNWMAEAQFQLWTGLSAQLQLQVHCHGLLRLCDGDGRLGAAVTEVHVFQ